MTSVAIIGTGFGGLAAAVRLKQAGVDDLVLFEKSGDVGGVWRDNTYPGAACDVPSHLYSLSFAPKADWSRRFAPQAEIHQYLRDVARDFDVQRAHPVRHRGAGRGLRRGHRPLAAHPGRGSGARGRRPDHGHRSAQPAQHARTCPGWTPSRARSSTPRSGTTGTTSAASGSPSSAPAPARSSSCRQIAPQTARLTLFQRSAPYVLGKPDRAYRARALRAFARVPGLLRLSREGNYFSNELRSLGFNTEPRLLFAHRARFRRHLAREVPDPALRDKLTPADPMGCKRILMSNDWYPALQLPQVEVVDRADHRGARRTPS